MNPNHHISFKQFSAIQKLIKNNTYLSPIINVRAGSTPFFCLITSLTKVSGFPKTVALLPEIASTDHKKHLAPE